MTACRPLYIKMDKSYDSNVSGYINQEEDA